MTHWAYLFRAYTLLTRFSQLGEFQPKRIERLTAGTAA
jgi:hypothetical protein